MKKTIISTLLFGFVLGVLWLGAIRFFTYERNDIHYHANFAVYIDGKQVPFDGIQDYEEVTACSTDGNQTPKTRVHMHDRKNWVVHVHDSGVTWAQFFENLGISIADNAIVMPDGKIYANNATEQNTRQLHFVLNNESVDTLVGREIGDEDVLLISYDGSGELSSNDGLQQQYDAIPKDADEVDKSVDPATCSGSEPITWRTRLKHVFWFD